MSKNNGGWAFPVNDGPYFNQDSGMTMRDYFASKAMQSIPLSLEKNEQSLIAQAAYKMADAMLEARNK